MAIFFYSSFQVSWMVCAPPPPPPPGFRRQNIKPVYNRLLPSRKIGREPPRFFVRGECSTAFSWWPQGYQRPHFCPDYYLCFGSPEFSLQTMKKKKKQKIAFQRSKVFCKTFKALKKIVCKYCNKTPC